MWPWLCQCELWHTFVKLYYCPQTYTMPCWALPDFVSILVICDLDGDLWHTLNIGHNFLTVRDWVFIYVPYVHTFPMVTKDFKRDLDCELWPTFVKLKHCPRKLTQCLTGPFLTLSVIVTIIILVQCIYDYYTLPYIIDTTKKEEICTRQ